MDTVEFTIKKGEVLVFGGLLSLLGFDENGSYRTKILCVFSVKNERKKERRQ